MGRKCKGEEIRSRRKLKGKMYFNNAQNASYSRKADYHKSLRDLGFFEIYFRIAGRNFRSHKQTPTLVSNNISLIRRQNLVFRSFCNLIYGTFCDQIGIFEHFPDKWAEIFPSN